MANRIPLIIDSVSKRIKELPSADNLDLTGNGISAVRDIIPESDEQYSLGSSTNRWNSLYVSGSTIYIGDATISVNSGNIQFAIGENTASIPISSSQTFASLAGAETLTNKTINLANNTLSATSEQIRSAVSDETGTGFLVFNGSPTFTGTANFAGISTTGNLSIGGDLIVNGTTTNVESTVVTIKDPVFTLGGTTPLTVDDGKDRGIEYKWHNGVSAKTGFFGVDNSTGYFTFIPDATNTSELFSGLAGDIQASNFRGNLIGNVTGNVTGNVDTATKLATSRTISLGGDLSGSAEFDGSSDITITATVTANNVALGTDTTGNYVATIAAGTGMTVTGSGTETAAVTIGIDSTVATLSDTQTLTNKTISGSSNTITNIANSSLTNSSVTIGTTNIALGSSSTTLAGLTSVTSTTFVGNLTGEVSSLANHTTTNLTEGTNLYYTTARFDTRLASKSTTDLTEGTNLYYTTSRVNTDFDTRLATKSTTDLTEGTNLYYTTARFDTRLATKSTTDLTEGTNLYYTDARARESNSAGTGISYNNITGVIAVDTSVISTKSYVDTSVSNLVSSAPETLDTLNELAAAIGDDPNFATTLTTLVGTKLNTSDFNTTFDTRLATKSTSDLTEGTNLYYTTARANTDFDTRLATKSTSNLTEGTNLYYTTSRVNTDFDTRLATKSTTDLTEGTNLYYTTARFDTRLATKSTSDLTEGTNLYYTTARTNTDFDTRLATKSTSDLTEGTNLYYTTARANTDFDTRLATKSTTDLTEGTNLYYTDERVDDRVSSLLVAGTNVSLSYNDNANTLTISANDTSVNWSEIQDKPDPVITVTLTGDVTGTGNTTLTDLASGTISFATTIANNSVALGTDTTGNYIATVAGTTNQVTVSGSGSESAAVTLSLPQDIHTGATPQFAGATLTSALAMGTNKITGLGTPTISTDAATKEYVDTLVARGIHFHEPVRVESPINLNATYNNGTAGVGATLTNAGTQAALVIDGITMVVADRVLVYEQTNETQNGVYVVTNVGSGSTNWILTRSNDADTYEIDSPEGISEGSTFFVRQGTTGAGETYTCNTSGTITFGTTNITFAQISSAQIYSAGTGLTLTGTEYSVNASQTQVTAVGTLTSGTWNASVIAGQYGGTGVANTGKTITLGGSLTTSGAHTTTLTTSGNTNVTLPTTGTLATIAGTETLTNKTLTSPTLTTPVLGTPSSGTLTNCTGLPVSGITASTSTALGVGSIELGHATDTTIARSAAGVVTIEGVEIVTLSRTQTLTNKTLTSPVITGVSPTITLTGDVTGTGTLTNLGSVSFVTTIAANSVALGTDTTGNYVADVTAGTGITVTHAAGEGSSAAIAVDTTTIATKAYVDSQILTKDNTDEIAEGTTNLYFTNARARSSLSDGTGISYSTSTGVITNSAPDQTVAITGAGGAVVTGTYPNFTVTTPSGTVTSVGGTGTVSGLSLSGTVTSTGNLTLGGTLSVTPSNFASQTANTILAAPNGSSGSPTFRSLVAADIPNLDAAKITSGTIDAARLPSYVDDVLEYANLAGFPGTGETGKIYIALDTNKTYRWSGSAYVFITSGAVDSVAGKTGVVTLVKADVGLGNVDNTADANKSVSSAATLTTGRTVAITGDLTYTSGSFNGSANVTGTGTLATVNSNVGSFTNASVTVNAKGLVTAVSSGTAPVTSVGGTGTVSGLTLTGTVTSTGNLTLGGTLSVTPSNFASQTANTVLVAPNGSAGVPTFRTLVAADIPTLNQNTTGTSSNVTGTVAIANGGTGATTAANALTALGAYAASNPSAYINQAGARTAVSFTAGSGAYNNTTGVFTIPTNTNQLTNGAGFTTNTGTVTSIVAGTGLSGGTITTTGTIALANTAVTAGSYTTANITVDAQGRITAASNGSGGGLTTTDDTTTNATYYPVVATTAGGSTAKTSSTKLSFNPSTGTLTATALNTSSDENFKTNIEKIINPMEVLNQVDGVGFNFIDSGKKSYGVIAQQLEQVLPELVTTNEDGNKSVNYLPIIGFLIEAVKEQQKQIDSLINNKKPD